MFRSLLSCVALSVLVGLAAGQPAIAFQSSSRGGAKAAPASVVNINTASLADLQTLPGVGARMAARIVEYRQKNGPFKKIEELMNVQGIGEKNFLKLKPQITVSAAKSDRQASSGN
jgi:competence protein ComEA